MNDRAPKQDNLTLHQKVMLRQTALAMLRGETPVICETHGGRGDVFASVYTGVECGAVFEKDPDKSVLLAAQRPTWSVYETDVEMAMAAGAAGRPAGATEAVAFAPSDRLIREKITNQAVLLSGSASVSSASMWTSFCSTPVA